MEILTTLNSYSALSILNPILTQFSNANIFEYALKDADLNPSETLFIDDLEKNIDVADKMGINTIWLDISKGDDIREKLNGF